MIDKILKILKIKFQGECILIDGTPCILDGDLSVGVGIKIQTPDGIKDMPDGNFELETGQIITVASGKITDIVEQVDTEEKPDNQLTPSMNIEKPDPLSLLMEKITQIETKLENLPTYTEELTKLKSDVDFILGKVTLSTELKKSKPINESNSLIDSRIELIKSIRNTNTKK